MKINIGKVLRIHCLTMHPKTPQASFVAHRIHYKKLLAEIKILKVVIVCQKYISNHQKMIILTSFYYIIKL